MNSGDIVGYSRCRLLYRVYFLDLYTIVVLSTSLLDPPLLLMTKMPQDPGDLCVEREEANTFRVLTIIQTMMMSAEHPTSQILQILAEIKPPAGKSQEIQSACQPVAALAGNPCQRQPNNKSEHLLLYPDEAGEVRGGGETFTPRVSPRNFRLAGVNSGRCAPNRFYCPANASLWPPKKSPTRYLSFLPLSTPATNPTHI